MYFSLVLLPLLVGAAPDYTKKIRSVDGTQTWSCPRTEVDETKALELCPPFSGIKGMALTGASTVVAYSGTPDSFKTKQGDIQLFCNYGEDTQAISCGYTGGGNTAFVALSSNARDCPARLHQGPIPYSGGKPSLTRAPLVCPQVNDASQPLYITTTEILTGAAAMKFVGFLPGISKNDTAFDYECVYSDLNGNRIPSADCSYVQYKNGTLHRPSTANGDNPACPSTLCNANQWW